jgi:multiple sugar transport system permease protein
VYITFQLPFGIFMMRNAFDSVPQEIEEAALVDGCGPFGAMRRVMLPIVAPGIVTVVMFAFLAAWNEFLAALILLGSQEKFTLPIMMLLSAQSGVYGTVNWGALQAGVTITMLPAAALFLILQRYYIAGLASGAVKA